MANLRGTFAQFQNYIDVIDAKKPGVLYSAVLRDGIVEVVTAARAVDDGGTDGFIFEGGEVTEQAFLAVFPNAVKLDVVTQ